eukprot:6875241-Pyramimonas_sp.AAC.1
MLNVSCSGCNSLTNSTDLLVALRNACWKTAIRKPFMRCSGHALVTEAGSVATRSSDDALRPTP